MRYQPFYCEENIWWLCAEPPPGVTIEQVIFVAGLHGICPIAEQRAGGVDGIAWWDYHCIGLDHERRIWDLDSRLPLPVAASTWLARSFPNTAGLPAALQPLFRLVPGADYLRDFCSDRRHMRSADGGWLQPPPPWPCIGADENPATAASDRQSSVMGHAGGAAGSNLLSYRDLSEPDEGPGVVLDLAAFRAACR
ncbi:protein N-terminal glutamine amidohydrolase [Halochromatium sp.]